MGYERCQSFTALYQCGEKAVVKVGDQWLCLKCAAIEKGRLEESEKALLRALSKARSLLKPLKKIKSSPYAGGYRVVVRTDDGEDDV